VLSTGEAVEADMTYIPAQAQHRVTFRLPDKCPNAYDTVICIETEEDEVLLDSLDSL
jgi:hypothetical protein